MAEWRKGLVWIGAGFALVVLAMTFSILGDADAHGGELALFVVTFYAGFAGGAFALVRGALFLMQHMRRQAALRFFAATVGGIVLAIVLHNVVYAITGVEEAFFFLLALLVGPVALVAAVIRLFRPYEPLPHA